MLSSTLHKQIEIPTCSSQFALAVSCTLYLHTNPQARQIISTQTDLTLLLYYVYHHSHQLGPQGSNASEKHKPTSGQTLLFSDSFTLGFQCMIFFLC